MNWNGADRFNTRGNGLSISFHGHRNFCVLGFRSGRHIHVKRIQIDLVTQTPCNEARDADPIRISLGCIRQITGDNAFAETRREWSPDTR